MTPDQLKTVLGNMSSMEKKNLSSDQSVAKAIYDKQQIIKKATPPTETIKSQDPFGKAQANMQALLDKGIDPQALQTLITTKTPKDKIQLAQKALNAVLQVNQQKSGVNQLVSSFKKPVNPIASNSPISLTVGAIGDEAKKIGGSLIQGVKDFSTPSGIYEHGIQAGKNIFNEAYQGGTEVGTGLKKIKSALLPSANEPQDFTSRLNTFTGGGMDVVGGGLKTIFSPITGIGQELPVAKEALQLGGDIIGTGVDIAKVGGKAAVEKYQGYSMTPDQEYAFNKGLDIVPQLLLAKGGMKGLPSLKEFTDAVKGAPADIGKVKQKVVTGIGNHLEGKAQEFAKKESGMSGGSLAKTDKYAKTAGYQNAYDYMLQNDFPLGKPLEMISHADNLLKIAIQEVKPEIISKIQKGFSTAKYTPLIETLQDSLVKTKSPEMQAIKTELDGLKSRPYLTAAELERLRYLSDQYLDLQYTGTEKAVVKDKQNMVDAARKDLGDADPTGVLRKKNAEIQALKQMQNGLKNVPYKAGTREFYLPAPLKIFVEGQLLTHPEMAIGGAIGKAVLEKGTAQITASNIYKLSKKLKGESLSAIPEAQVEAIKNAQDTRILSPSRQLPAPSSKGEASKIPKELPKGTIDLRTKTISKPQKPIMLPGNIKPNTHQMEITKGKVPKVSIPLPKGTIDLRGAEKVPVMPSQKDIRYMKIGDAVARKLEKQDILLAQKNPKVIEAIKNDPYFKKEGSVPDIDSGYLMTNKNGRTRLGYKKNMSELLSQGWKRGTELESIASEYGFSDVKDFLDHQAELMGVRKKSTKRIDLEERKIDEGLTGIEF